MENILNICRHSRAMIYMYGCSEAATEFLENMHSAHPQVLPDNFHSLLKPESESTYFLKARH